MNFLKVLLVFNAVLLIFPVSGFSQNSQTESLLTEDGWKIEISYYNKNADDGNKGEKTPVVILLPGDKGNRLNWEGSSGFANDLYRQGYAVVTVDPRKFGKSTPPVNSRKTVKKLVARDYANIVQYDLEAVKGFLFEQHQQKKINMAKLAIIAPESMAPIATAYAVRDWKKPPHKDAAVFEHRTPRGQDVKALVLISPTMNLGGFPGNRAINEIKQPAFEVAVGLYAGKNDSAGVKQVDKMYRLLTGNIKPDETRVSLYTKEIFPSLGQRGTELLKRNNGIMENKISEFLRTQMGQLKIEWRDRRTRYERGE